MGPLLRVSFTYSPIFVGFVNPEALAVADFSRLHLNLPSCRSTVAHSANEGCVFLERQCTPAAASVSLLSGGPKGSLRPSSKAAQREVIRAAPSFDR
jgi:hypothetical protein